ncbi:MAG TPA: DUF1801 domain-containing protein [Candidatus Eisenbacteria bacterium]|nr:DUF1801 domain-containing protein [Candidatus Eisenbacteria bacterium]
MAASNQVNQLLSSYPPEVRALALGVRRIVEKDLPGADEVVDRSANLIGYGYGTGYANSICTIILSKKGVKLGLIGGASLPDPRGLLEGTGKVHRYVAFEDPADLEQPGVTALLKAGLAAWKKRSAAGAKR